MTYKSQLERIRKELEERKDDLSKELLNLPEGVLLCTGERKHRKYYQRLPAIGNRKKERRYGIKTRPKMLAGLARKKYVTKALEVIDGSLMSVDAACKTYAPIDEISVMESFTKKYPELADYIYQEPFNEEEWRNEVQRIDDYHPEDLKQTDADGIKRRSKNEIYIASRLDHYEIIYRSDCPTGIPGLKWAPDFTILRVRDHKKLYWEHFGMMGDPAYRARNKVKLQDYEDAGIVPWDNLIITYDMDGGDMRADIIEANIKCWLL